MGCGFVRWDDMLIGPVKDEMLGEMQVICC